MAVNLTSSEQKNIIAAQGNQAVDLSAAKQAFDNRNSKIRAQAGQETIAVSSEYNKKLGQPGLTDTQVATLRDEWSAANKKIQVAELGNLQNSDRIYAYDVAQAQQNQKTAEPAKANTNTNTNTNTKSNDASATPPETNIALSEITALGALPNPLELYPSYTYNLSLHLLSPDQYTNIVKTQEYTPTNVLIASAGRHGNNFVRNAKFKEDYYFDDLSIETIIGMNATSRATNAVHLNFKIIEPFGVSLLDRIILANEEVGQDNYIASPYLLQIDFFAIDDEGNIIGALEDHSKRIPIKLLKFDINVDAKGSTYEVEAVPYNHTAYDINTVALPTNFEIAAGTVGDFFGADRVSSLEDINRTAQRQITQSSNGKRNIAVSPALTSRELQKPLYKAESLSGALNIWHSGLKDTNKVEFGDAYFFKFHDDIGLAKFADVKEGTVETKNAPITARSQASKNAAAGSGAITDAEVLTQRIFTVSAGTSIDATLNYVIRHSSYIRDQITGTEDLGTMPKAYLTDIKQNKDTNTPLRWFKIVPSIKILDYDSVRQQYAREITYHILAYKIWNTKIASAPQGIASVPVKDYQYLYTGQNVNILSFNLTFNALYYTAVTAYKDRAARKENAVALYGKKKNLDSYTEEEKKRAIANKIAPTGIQPQVIQAQTQSTGMEEDATGVAAADIQESIYTNASADALALDMTIIGDPQFIKQDDIFYSAEFVSKEQRSAQPDQIANTVDPRLTPNNSIITDSGEVHIQITINSKVDYDEASGLMRSPSKDSTGNQSLFSGMYRVIRVMNKFTAGKFTQDLSLVRLPRQSQLSSDTSTTERATPTNQAATSTVNVDASQADTNKSIVLAADRQVGEKAKPLTTAPLINVDITKLKNASKNNNGTI